MQIFIGDFILEPIHIIGIVVIILIAIIAIITVNKQKTAIIVAQKKELEKDAGAEVPLSSVNLDLIEIIFKPVDETETEIEQFTTKQFKIFTKPNTQVSFNIAINGIQISRIQPGFFEHTFEEAGENVITVTLVENPSKYKEFKIQVSEFDFAKVQLNVAKDDLGYQTQTGVNDYYNVSITPDVPLKINIYVDDKYYTQVQGSSSFQCYFDNPGEHTFYAILDANQKVYTDYFTVNAFDSSASSEQGEDSGY